MIVRIFAWIKNAKNKNIRDFLMTQLLINEITSCIWWIILNINMCFACGLIVKLIAIYNWLKMMYTSQYVVGCEWKKLKLGSYTKRRTTIKKIKILTKFHSVDSEFAMSFVFNSLRSKSFSYHLSWFLILLQNNKK